MRTRYATLSNLCIVIVCIIVLFDSATANTTERTANLTVPVASLVFAGEGLQAPDAEGHFAVGIKLPQPSIRASNCDFDFLVVGMGSLNKPEDSLTAADLKAIARNRDYYNKLLATAKSGGTVKIPVRNNSEYLKVTNGVVYALYCILSIDEENAL